MHPLPPAGMGLENTNGFLVLSQAQFYVAVDRADAMDDDDDDDDDEANKNNYERRAPKLYRCDCMIQDLQHGVNDENNNSE